MRVLYHFFYKLQEKVEKSIVIARSRNDDEAIQNTRKRKNQ